MRAAIEQVLEQVGVDQGESRLAIGEGPADDTGEPTQAEDER